ncbi:platelet binding protein GspB-like [Rhagoletis pomonella]|uniref:platelet binding protein GspB-like n=1 Tax=Rhagoletis pomonella TaxID=28610 RepID=UPI00177BC96D|nr:platelet binding protein GspB-like [Rhagoletis pomonella]XP_036321684.1 platelet binding protein GspB-like [Rhagoletis pomonella]XP_036321685.1 platelet binding protein GspB-like [Rhagoletis pomonella]
MFGLLGSSQIYGLQQVHEYNSSGECHINNKSASSTHISNINTNNDNNNTNITTHKQRRSTSNNSESGSKFFASLSSMQGIKSPTNFIEKFIKNELLSGYETIKNYKNFQNSTNASGSNSTFFTSHPSIDEHSTATGCGGGSGSGGGGSGADNNIAESLLTSFNCLQGSYRSNCDGEFYEPVNVRSQRKQSVASTLTTATGTAAVTPAAKRNTEADMTIKYSKNLLANTPDEQSPATLQNYQKLSECEQDLLLTQSSGASSGEFNSDANGGSSGSSNQTTTPVNSLYKRLSFGGRGSKNATDNAAMSTTATAATAATNEIASDYSSSNNSSSSASSTLSSKTTSLSLKSIDLQRTSSASSSGDCAPLCERRKSSPNADSADPAHSSGAQQLTPERAQRRKLISMISHFEQQNKLLQRELAKEKRRRSEDLACVAKSLLCFESKLKKDMIAVNHRLLEKDTEICRLVQQNRALRKRLIKITEAEGENARDEGVVEDGEPETEAEGECGGEDDDERSGKTKKSALERGTAPASAYSDRQLLEDCLVLEALQCINCKKQFYDIDLNESWTQNTQKDGTRKNVDHTTEHGSSSDDTVSSSFYGARRSVRYTSKRTSGTFRDYMRSRAMNIDDPALDNNSEENTSTISRDDSQTSYEKLNIYSRTIERMHGVKGESERESEQSGMEGTVRSVSRLSSKSSSNSKGSLSSCSKNSAKTATPQIEEDDGIFSPTQDDDFEEPEDDGGRSIKIVMRRSTDFSEASPKQVYETSTDDWYASASDQEEITPTTAASKSYAHGAVNPVLECVNQILLQQSMEEPMAERANEATTAGSKLGQCLQVGYSNSTSTANLPRRSSLSGRRSSRNNSHSSDGQPSRNGTLTRKRVHFSTKNSMVHVPRNDEHDEEDEDVDDDVAQDAQTTNDAMISNLAQYHSMSYYPQATQQAASTKTATGNIARGGMLAEVPEHERLETLNYESIYSNEYEPIGSEHNSSNLYVDMESTAAKTTATNATNNAVSAVVKVPKIPPALPPKPANLLKFKKSLQQLDELPDEHLHQDGPAAPEPDYCSISEVNVGITSVQIVADVHKAPESEADSESNLGLEAPISELDAEVSTVASDETCPVSQKTDEIEEIFADVPKLPNVAAIIAPKQSKFPQPQQLQALKPSSDYLLMSPKVESPNMKLQNARNATILNTATATKPNSAGISSPNNNNSTPKVLGPATVDYLNTPIKSPNRPDPSALKLHLHTPSPLQYKRKHMPNILAEINKRMSLPNSPTTPTARLTFTTPAKPASATKTTLQQKLEINTPTNMPMQAEFDWYNLDAEYGRTPSQQPDLLKVSDTLNNGTMLAGIHEDGESIATAADEYNLDEEFSLAGDKPDILSAGSEPDNESAEEKSEESVVENKRTAKPQLTIMKHTTQEVENTKLEKVAALNAAICEAVNFPMFGESSPLVPPSPAVVQQHHAKAKKIKKNLANFEKFIEGSGLSTKPLPSKRKIYFAGPFV